MRKVERYEIADGRTYDNPTEALDAELIHSICATVPCSVQVGENIKAKWSTLLALMEKYAQDRASYPTISKPEDLGPMPHFG